jgi:nucleoside-diphosphate-sugar epimerase
MKVFLAGASGVIGRPLVPLLIKAGHQVTGTTRSRDKARDIEAAGATAAVVDVYDAAALMDAVQAAKPDVVMHQLTDLPDQNDPAEVAASLTRNMRIRVEGTPNLIAAAKAAGARRLIAQSLAFVYADGPEPHPETDPLQPDDGSPSIRGVLALERLTLGTPGLDGIVLRYGRLYGPGTWNGDTPPQRSPLHVDGAAQAALLALDHGKPGTYNIAEDDGVVSIAKARAELRFDPGFRVTQ